MNLNKHENLYNWILGIDIGLIILNLFMAGAISIDGILYTIGGALGLTSTK